ncbi:MAG: hypothetical protein ACYS5V_08295, partial [Planctomycetota bacterium]
TATAAFDISDQGPYTFVVGAPTYQTNDQSIFSFDGTLLTNVSDDSFLTELTFEGGLRYTGGAPTGNGEVSMQLFVDGTARSHQAIFQSPTSDAVVDVRVTATALMDVSSEADWRVATNLTAEQNVQFDWHAIHARRVS